MSESDRHRQRGNEIFKSVTTGLSPVVQQMRLKEAWNWYKSALEYSTTAEEKASAKKNFAMVSWKLASLGKDAKAKILFFFKDAMRYFGEALELKSDANKSTTWAESLVQNMYKCLLDYLKFVDIHKNMSDERLELLSMAYQLFPDGALRADVSLRYVEILLEKSIHFLIQDNFTRSKSILGNCYQPLEIAKNHGSKKEYLVKKFKALSIEVTRQTAVVEARQALKMGDDLKEIVLKSKPYDIDMAFEIIDRYREAITLMREMDAEMEAIALSRIGVVYKNILNLKDLAIPYFRNAKALADSLHPRVFTEENWYQICKQAIEEPRPTPDEEMCEWMREREEIIGKLQPQIERFKDIENHYKCIRHVYNNHPPKNEKHKLPEDLPSEIERPQLRKLLQKAIVHYHPDYNPKEKYGKEWYVLCEEITKVFTCRYNDM